MAGAAQHICGIAKSPLASLETIIVRDPAVLHRNLAVLDDLQRDLVVHLLDAEAGSVLVLDNESLHRVVGDVARPHDRDVAPRRVANPALLTVEDPSVAFALRRRRHTAGRS